MKVRLVYDTNTHDWEKKKLLLALTVGKVDVNIAYGYKISVERFLCEKITYSYDAQSTRESNSCQAPLASSPLASSAHDLQQRQRRT